MANEVNLKTAIDSYFEGKIINQTENRAVLHTALRSPETATVLVDGINVIPEIYNVKNAIQKFSNEIFREKEKDIQGRPLPIL